MRNRAAAAESRKPFAPFQKGQIWKVGNVNLVVTSVGKTLVHYKQYKTQPRGIQTTLSSKPDLEKYLLNRNATLVTA